MSDQSLIVFVYGSLALPFFLVALASTQWQICVRADRIVNRRAARRAVRLQALAVAFWVIGVLLWLVMIAFPATTDLQKLLYFILVASVPLTPIMLLLMAFLQLAEAFLPPEPPVDRRAPGERSTASSLIASVGSSADSGGPAA
jgi:hypothetical protein